MQGNMESKRPRDQTILILAPTGRDAELTARFLAEASLRARVCVTIDDICDQMKQAAGVVLLTEESLTLRSLALLARALMAQPAWSDIPIILLTSGGCESPVNTEGLASLGRDRQREPDRTAGAHDDFIKHHQDCAARPQSPI
jgi:hypothetical protein